MKFIFLFLFITFSFLFSFSQDAHLIDSLETKLKSITAQKKELGNKTSFAIDSLSATILYALSRAYWSNNPDKSLDYANKCLEISEQVGYKRGIGKAYNSIGAINYIKGDYFKAIDFHTKSLKIREEIKDKAGIAESYSNIAIVNMQQGKYP